MRKITLPKYKKIKVDDIPKASTLLFYHGNKLTEFIGRYVYKHPYYPPAFHAAIYTGGVKNQLLNVGKFVTLDSLEDEFRSTRRIDVVIYKQLTMKERGLAIKRGMKDLGKPYDMMGFLSFGKKIPLIGKLFSWAKGSKQLPYCSDHVVDSFKAAPYQVSGYNDEETAPWQLLEYAERYPKTIEIRTVWIGPDF